GAEVLGHSWEDDPLVREGRYQMALDLPYLRPRSHPRQRVVGNEARGNFLFRSVVPDPVLAHEGERLADEAVKQGLRGEQVVLVVLLQDLHRAAVRHDELDGGRVDLFGHVLEAKSERSSRQGDSPNVTHQGTALLVLTGLLPGIDVGGHPTVQVAAL